MKFSQKLKEMRKFRGLTQQELAEKAGVTKQIISNSEREYTMPNSERISMIAKALNCKVDDLLDDIDDSQVDYEKIMFSDKPTFDNLPADERKRIIDNLQEQADFMIEKARRKQK